MHTLLTVLQEVMSSQYGCTRRTEQACTAKRARSAGWGRDSLEREGADRVDRELVVLVGLERHLWLYLIGGPNRGERRRDEEDRGSTR